MSSRNESSRKNGTAAGTAAKARHAPAPDDERKADWPTHLDGSSWKYIFKRSIKEFSREKCTDLAAALTYFAMLSLFPALLALGDSIGTG